MRFPFISKQEIAPSEEKKAFSKPLKIGLIVGAAVLVVSYAGTFVWAGSYEGRMAPNVLIGNIKVGGETSEEAKQAINTAVDKILLDGVQLSVDGKLGTVPLSSVGSEAGDYVSFDVNGVVETALAAHHSEIPALRPFTILFSLTHKSKIKVPLQIDEEKLKAAVLNAFPESIQPAVDAGFVFEKTESGWQATTTASAEGLTIPTDDFFSQLQTLLAELDPQPIVLSRAYEKPLVVEADADKLLTAAVAAMNAAPYSLTYEGQTWEINAETLATALKPSLDENKQTVLSVSADGLKTTLDEIAAAVEKPAVDARLVMENERVTDFQGSSNGVAIDREDTVKALAEIIQAAGETKSSELVVTITEPAIKMESINDLGIKEVLGTGTSNYKGSPSNRIKNIRNGVRLLNGILIKPGEEFSLLEPLRPFTTDNGYLPELVIKGDKIEPEVGGGLCQIGTTTFRAAMNSGLPITARSNHSLVVSYYNDPTNNKPGTDATIYDPAPDLKFINDTGNYIIFQAEMDEANTTLRFSFWGTSDGRIGSYTPPTLIRWIGVGEDQITETLDLAPGVEQCQAAHVGADTTFTYTIQKADGTKDETVFDSHYRPLPKICLVGVAELTLPDETAPTDTTTPTDTTIPIAE